jgi:pimeloyl-ACP methyl ester carboxylesterase
MSSTIPLVLLPGLDGSDVFFKPLMAALPAWITPRVVTYPRDGDQGYGRLLRHVRTRLADLPAYWVLGSSFGGPLALKLAAAEPSRVQGVVLSTSFVRVPVPGLKYLRALAQPPLVYAVRAARRMPVWFGRRPDDPFRIAKAETWRQVSARELSARVRAVARADARAELAASRHPLLCIAAAEDSVVPARNLQDMLALRPDAVSAMLPGSHMALFHHGADAARVIGDFIVQAQDRAFSRRSAPAR